MMTVPTSASAARPFNFDWSDGPSVAAETWAAASSPNSATIENTAEIFLSIAFKFSPWRRDSKFGFGSADLVSVDKIAKTD
jgi:hypothetical protein